MRAILKRVLGKSLHRVSVSLAAPTLLGRYHRALVGSPSLPSRPHRADAV